MSKNLGKMLYIVMAKKDRPGGIRDFLKQLPTKTCISNNKKVHFRTKQAIYSLARDSDLKTNHSPLTMPLESWTAAARVYYKTSDIWWRPPPTTTTTTKFLNFDVGWQGAGSEIRFLAILGRGFSANLLQIWWKHGYGIAAPNHYILQFWSDERQYTPQPRLRTYNQYL